MDVTLAPPAVHATKLQSPVAGFTIQAESSGKAARVAVEHSEAGDAAEALLRQAERGDPKALDRLLEMHRKELLRFVGSRLPPLLRARVDEADIVQEAFVEAARRFPDFLRDRPMPLRLWLLQIARDRLVMEQRKHIRAARRSVVREVLISDESSVRLSSLMPAAGSTPSRRVRRAETADKVREALGLLDDTDREIVLSRMMDDMSFADIGLLFGCLEASARKRFSRALDRLYDALVSLGWSDHDRAG
jgi:RNA polymerase sigma-70 factor (ECF subfamily)